MARVSDMIAGFNLAELLLVIGLAGLVAVIAVPAYTDHVDRTRNEQAIADIGRISLDIDRFRLSNGDTLPPNLAVLGVDDMRDPWGNPYHYRVVAGADRDRSRKDRILVPINTDFDLYSSGPDGESVPALTSGASRDDIVRANNGNFIGRAEDY